MGKLNNFNNMDINRKKIHWKEIPKLHLICQDVRQSTFNAVQIFSSKLDLSLMISLILPVFFLYQIDLFLKWSWISKIVFHFILQDQDHDLSLYGDLFLFCLRSFYYIKKSISAYYFNKFSIVYHIIKAAQKAGIGLLFQKVSIIDHIIIIIEKGMFNISNIFASHWWFRVRIRKI